VRKADNLPSSGAVVTKSGNLNFLEYFGPVQACNGIALPLPLPVGLGVSWLMWPPVPRGLSGPFRSRWWGIMCYWEWQLIFLGGGPYKALVFSRYFKTSGRTGNLIVLLKIIRDTGRKLAFQFTLLSSIISPKNSKTWLKKFHIVEHDLLPQCRTKEFNAAAVWPTS